MKKILSLAVVFALLVTILLPTVSLAESDIVKVMIDGKTQVFDVSPTIKEGRTLVPLRGSFEKLGANVKWDQKSRTVTIEKFGKIVELTVGSKQAIVNGEKVPLDVPAQIVDNRVLAPLSFIVDSLGAKINWNGKTKTVSITSLENWLLKTMNTEMNSYSMELLLDQSMEFAGETMDMNMKMYADMIVDPLQMYSEVTMEMFGQEVITKEYMTEEGYYVLDPTTEGWIKYPDEMLNSILELSSVTNNDPLAQYELLIDHMEELVAIEGSEHYILKMKIGNDGFMAMMNEMLAMLQGVVGQEDITEMFNSIAIDELEYVTYFDKKTFLPVGIKSDMKMAIEVEGEKMTLQQSLVGDYSNFNEVDSITIPQEVIDQAVNLEDINEDDLYGIE